jgi:hypothetical protein
MDYMKICSILFLFCLFPQFSFSQAINSDDLHELIINYELYCIDNCSEITWKNVKILFTLSFEGTDVPPADMIFLTNSIMILNSRFYSQDNEKHYFKYILNNNELTLIPIDSRLNIVLIIETEKHNMVNDIRNYISINEIKNYIIFNFGNVYKNSFYFNGVLFD